MRIMHYTSQRIVAGRALQKSEDCSGKRKAENRGGKNHERKGKKMSKQPSLSSEQ